jgi:endoglucanase
MLEVHCYDPWNFCYETKGTWGTQSDKTYVDDMYSRLKYEFFDKGIPVLLGEYGVCGYDIPDRAAYIEYVTKAAVSAGVIPCWWDNGSLGTGPDTFGIINRNDNTVYDDVALDAIMSAKG